MMGNNGNNVRFFRNNVDFYSEEYKDYELKPWEMEIMDLVSGPLVLDVACGGGRMTVPLLRRGYNVVGTDFVGEFEAKIRSHEAEFASDFKFVKSEMTSLPFDDDTFDAVTCINSIVYLRNREELQKALGEMARVLKPSGILFVTTWNIRHPYWGISVVLNYLLRRGKRFGETSPFWTTDGRIANSRTYMYAPPTRVLKEICRDAGINAGIYTGLEFIGEEGLKAYFHPILVIGGWKVKNI